LVVAVVAVLGAVAATAESSDSPSGSLTAWGVTGLDGGDSHPPRAVGGELGRVVSVAAGWHDFFRNDVGHSLAVDERGRVWAFGTNDAGQAGKDPGNTKTVQLTENYAAPLVGQPEPVGGLSEVTGVAAGSKHSLAVDEAGQAWAFGDNSRRGRRAAPRTRPGGGSGQPTAAADWGGGGRGRPKPRAGAHR
jgi:hypothetical protein